MSSPVKFPFLQYLAMVLLFGPVVVMAGLWVSVIVMGLANHRDWNGLRDEGASLMAVGLGAAVICFFAEWLILPFVIRREHHRTRLTP